MEHFLSQLKAFESIDAVYVLSVESFTDRIDHIEKELAKHNIPFEFIFDHDVSSLSDELLDRHFDKTTKTGAELKNAHKSLVLKHIAAWRKAVERNQKNILVFEDDVFLHSDFNQKRLELMECIKKIDPGYLVFLGGENTRIPKELLLEKKLIFEHPIPTAEGYITDIVAIQKRLNWVSNHLIDLPADHLIKLIDRSEKIMQYWSTTPLVRQGSVFGVFRSTLDKNRQKRSSIYNKFHYAWTILHRKTMPRLFYRCAEKIKKLTS